MSTQYQALAVLTTLARKLTDDEDRKVIWEGFKQSQADIKRQLESFSVEAAELRQKEQCEIRLLRKELSETITRNASESSRLWGGLGNLLNENSNLRQEVSRASEENLRLRKETTADITNLHAQMRIELAQERKLRMQQAAASKCSQPIVNQHTSGFDMLKEQLNERDVEIFENEQDILQLKAQLKTTRDELKDSSALVLELKTQLQDAKSHMENYKQRFEKLRALLSEKKDQVLENDESITDSRVRQQSMQRTGSGLKSNMDTDLRSPRPSKRCRIRQAAVVFFDKENNAHDASQLELDFEKIRSYIGTAQRVAGENGKRLLYHCIRAISQKQISTFSSRYMGTACLECTRAQEPCVRLAENRENVWRLLPLIPRLREGEPNQKEYWIYTGSSQVVWDIFNGDEI